MCERRASGQEANQYSRRPALGFVPQTYAEHHPELAAPPFENPLAHWVRAGKPAGPWSHAVNVPSASPPPGASTLRTALHIHLHYPELAAGLLRALAVNASRLDLFVSTTSEQKAADLEQRFKAYLKGPVVVEAAPNRGPRHRPDAHPLRRPSATLRTWSAMSTASAASRSPRSGSARTLACNGTTSCSSISSATSFPMVDIILGRFAAARDLGLVFPEDPNLTGWSLDRDLAVEIAARMDPAMRVPRFIDFPIGTMFWMRPAAFKLLFDLGLDWSDYPEEPVPIDGTMLHALERLFPVICEHAGYSVETTHVPGVTR